MSQPQQWAGSVRATFGASSFEDVYATVWTSSLDDWGGSLLIRSSEPPLRLDDRYAVLDFGPAGTVPIRVEQVIPLASLGPTAATVVRFQGAARLEDRFNVLFEQE